MILDDPNVNLKFLKLVNEDHELNEYPSLIDIGFHTIYRSLKTSINLDGSLGKN